MDETTNEPLCLSCNKPGTLRCSSCSNARYCSTDCQKRDWKQHKAVCRSFSTLPQRPTPEHIRAILFPVDEEKPRFVWIQGFSNWWYDYEETYGALLGNPDHYESGTIEHHFKHRRPLLDNKTIKLHYNATFAIDGSPNSECIKRLNGVKQGHKWCGSFIAFGYHEVDDDVDDYMDAKSMDVTSVDLDTNDLGGVVGFFNSRVGSIPECCLPGSTNTCGHRLRDAACGL
jgi:hypothetical protein